MRSPDLPTAVTAKARASANEVMSCVEVAELHGAVPEALAMTLATQLERADQMLAGMVRRRSS